MRAAVVLQQLHMHVGGPIFEQKVPPIPLFAELLKCIAHGHTFGRLWYISQTFSKATVTYTSPVMPTVSALVYIASKWKSKFSHKL